MEVQTCGRPQEKAVWQDSCDTMQTEGGGKDNKVHIHTVELAYARMDKLLPDRQYERLSWRVWTMVEAQGESDNHQAVEATENYIQKSDEAEQDM